jgi:hypothetical protein
VDRELLAYFLRDCSEQVAASAESGERAAPVMVHIVERLPDLPAVVFSRCGEVLAQTRLASALFGDCVLLGGASRYLVDRWWTGPVTRERYLGEVGVNGGGIGDCGGRLSHYRHVELGWLELYRELLVEPAQRQVLLVFTADPGSASEENLRRMAAAAAGG